MAYFFVLVAGSGFRFAAASLPFGGERSFAFHNHPYDQ